MTRATSNVVLLLVGMMTVQLAGNGTYARYVAVGFGPYLMAAGLVLVLLAVAAMILDVRRHGAEAAADSPHRAHAHSGHEHSGGVHWFLVAAVVVIVFVSPPPLSVSSVGNIRSEAIATVEREPFPPLPGGDAPEIGIADAVTRAARDSTDSLVGREITLTGFVVRTSNGGAPRADGSLTGLDLARIRIVCCAADARTVRVHLSPEVPAYPEGTWVSVRGVVDPVSSTPSTRYIPTLHVRSVTEIEAPDHPYAPR
ncbi:TIGR03943 family protein [Rhodococcus triatomae]|uniref:TIGR03943 family protein n=1 Tax=Rhodococcus triatomae TaxID=300028 RepID=A0A1G8CHF1_9NOCA|nr:TIGR03943 family protein [Rhodococcus triatomae]QNG18654.1 TIGR03943 family protein [Rhodococcus triatomae]QNG21676.1 TIGR03943 family protein [Rhodococcus triatomae]SDH44828.1 TIGR03943 family protein [Rhodococcus triatomae]